MRRERSKDFFCKWQIFEEKEEIFGGWNREKMKSTSKAIQNRRRKNHTLNWNKPLEGYIFISLRFSFSFCIVEGIYNYYITYSVNILWVFSSCNPLWILCEYTFEMCVGILWPYMKHFFFPLNLSRLISFSCGYCFVKIFSHDKHLSSWWWGY